MSVYVNLQLPSPRVDGKLLASFTETVSDGLIFQSGRALRGLKLLDFYWGLVAEADSAQPIWLIEGALSASPNLRKLPAVGENRMTLWMKQ